MVDSAPAPWHAVFILSKKIDQIIKKPDKVDKFIMPAFVGANPWSEDDSIPVMSHATSALKDTWKRRPSVVGAP